MSSQISRLKPGEEFPKQILLFEECSRGGGNNRNRDKEKSVDLTTAPSRLLWLPLVQRPCSPTSPAQGSRCRVDINSAGVGWGDSSGADAGKEEIHWRGWGGGRHLSPLPSACELPQLLSSAAIRWASLWLCGHKAVSQRAHAGFKHLLGEPCSCPAPSSQQDF